MYKSKKQVKIYSKNSQYWGERKCEDDESGVFIFREKLWLNIFRRGKVYTTLKAICYSSSWIRVLKKTMFLYYCQNLFVYIFMRRFWAFNATCYLSDFVIRKIPNYLISINIHIFQNKFILNWQFLHGHNPGTQSINRSLISAYTKVAFINILLILKLYTVYTVKYKQVHTSWTNKTERKHFKANVPSISFRTKRILFRC